MNSPGALAHAADAEGLLAAMMDPPRSPPGDGMEVPSRKPPRHLRVQVREAGHADYRVNLRVPFSLLRAGVRLTALLPAGVQGEINRALQQGGVDLDISQLTAKNLDELIDRLAELSLDVNDAQGESVRVYSE